MRRIQIVPVIFLLLVWCGTSYATFNSGSTGALGALTFNTMSSARHITLPASGILNYTTVNIPSGVTVTFIGNAANTPVYMLATGDVTINGTLNLNGAAGATVPGQGGPGGFNGGFGATNSDPAGRGMGPGGGYPGAPASFGCSNGGGGSFGTLGAAQCGTTGGAAGSTYGNVNLFPLIGGSGGGGCGYYNTGLINAGGGGGAILIASSGNIYLNGSVTANGGAGNWIAGSGSGGGIRLMANNIIGSGSLSAAGGNGGVHGGAGRIRLEAYTNNNTISSNPAYSYSNTMGSVFPTSAPSLVINSIGDVNVPASAAGLYSQPDIYLPNGTTSAVVNITAYNVPTSTQVVVNVVPQYGGDSSVNAAPLSGTQAQSTTSATVTTLSATYANVITVQATFTVSAMNYNGEEINRVRVAATLGGKSQTTYITKSGKEINGELVAALMR